MLSLHFGFEIADCGLMKKKQPAFQSAFRNPKSALSLSLLMLRVSADHTHHALAVDDLAVITHLFD
jgi:hypothetical protein